MARTEEDRRRFVQAYDALPRGSAERAAMREAAGVSHNVVAGWRSRLGMRVTVCACGADLAGRELRCVGCRRQAEREARLLRVYGLTPEDHAAMLAAQDGRCAGCGQLPPETGTRSQRVLHVDHDHETGRVRGLLCHPCNLALGYAQDDPARLIGLALYVASSVVEIPHA